MKLVLPRSFATCLLLLVTLGAFLVRPALGESILYASFEDPEKTTNGQDPTGWPQQGGHPSYFQLQVEGNGWTTPYGKQAVSTYSNGWARKTLGFVDGLTPATYTATFNITSSASIGEYRAELWGTFDAFGSFDQVLLAYVEGDTDGSKDMSYSDSITWVVDPAYDFYELELRLMQDPNRSNWRHTPIWDNVNVDYTPDNDVSGPQLVEITDNRGAGPIAPNTDIIFTVRFNEDVDESTVTAADFRNYSTAAISIGTITEVSPGVFTVVCTPTSSGSLRFGIADGTDGSVVSDLADPSGNVIDTSNPLDFVDLDLIDVEGSLPILLPLDIVDDRSGTPVKPGDPVTYTVSFSEDMNAATVTTADFGNAGTASVTVDSVTETSATSGVFTVVVTPGSSGTLELQVNQDAILEDTDTNGLDTSSAIVDDTTIEVDATVPTVDPGDPLDPDDQEYYLVDDTGGSPIPVGTPVTYELFFSEEMNEASVDASDFGNALSAGNAPFTINSVGQSSAGIFRIELTPTGTGSIRLQISQDAVLTDLAGNALDTSSAILDDTTITVENDDPYEAWAGGAAFAGTSGNDDLPNGLKWLLGAANASTPASSVLPTVSKSTGGLQLTFRCLNSSSRGGASLKVQFSSDVGVTDLWADNEAEVPDVDSTVNGIVFETTADGDFLDVVATIPGGGEVFSRLFAEPAP